MRCSKARRLLLREPRRLARRGVHVVHLARVRVGHLLPPRRAALNVVAAHVDRLVPLHDARLRVDVVTLAPARVVPLQLLGEDLSHLLPRLAAPPHPLQLARGRVALVLDELVLQAEHRLAGELAVLPLGRRWWAAAPSANGGARALFSFLRSGESVSAPSTTFWRAARCAGSPPSCSVAGSSPSPAFASPAVPVRGLEQLVRLAQPSVLRCARPYMRARARAAACALGEAGFARAGRLLLALLVRLGFEPCAQVHHRDA